MPVSQTLNPRLFILFLLVLTAGYLQHRAEVKVGMGRKLNFENRTVKNIPPSASTQVPSSSSSSGSSTKKNTVILPDETVEATGSRDSIYLPLFTIQKIWRIKKGQL